MRDSYTVFEFKTGVNFTFQAKNINIVILQSISILKPWHISNQNVKNIKIKIIFNKAFYYV